MALYLTTPKEIADFVQTNQLSICPSVSIVSDHWSNMGLIPSQFTKSVRNYSEISPLCFNLDLNFIDRFKSKPIPRYEFLDPPKIAWIDPSALIPHEPTSPVHLKRLISYLKDLDNDALLPTIIVTRSTPHVILDGHHRWQSSLALNIARVPCWVVDDLRADASSETLLPVPQTQFMNATSLHCESQTFTTKYTYYRVRVYDTRAKVVLRINDIAKQARAQALHPSTNTMFGVKGTKHVAIRVPVVSSAPVLPMWSVGNDSKLPGSTAPISFHYRHHSVLKEEVRLEKVAPLVEWGLWKSAGSGYCPKYLNGIDVAKLRPISDLGEAGVSLAIPASSGSSHH